MAKKLMTVEEAISSLTSSTSIRFVDKQGGDGYIAGNYNCKNTVTVKWLKKNHDNKYQKYPYGNIWDNYKVRDITTDEHGIVTIHLNCGLTRKQEAAKDRKFRKKHNGMSEAEVRHRKATRLMANLFALPLLLGGCSRPEPLEDPWFDVFFNKDKRR